MKKLSPLFALAVLAAAPSADGVEPGSVLVFPVVYSGGQVTSSVNAVQQGGMSILSVTNTNLTPSTPADLGGATSVHFEYVNAIELNGEVDHCQIIDRTEYLTPADTISVAAVCHNAASFGGGYLVVSAQDPNAFDVDWDFDHLIGSELVIDPFGLIFTLNAIPFRAQVGEGAPTDVDLDGQLDFDGVEYEGIPDELYIDSFVAVINSGLVLVNLSGGPKHDVTVAFDIFNDNEFPLSATTSFRCWMQKCLGEDQQLWFPGDEEEESVSSNFMIDKCISAVFSHTFLANNTPNDPQELDLDCDGVNDLETGWARIRGLQASSPAESIQNPALLGAIVGGPYGGGGHRLWESEAVQLNGDFLNTGVVSVD